MKTLISFFLRYVPRRYLQLGSQYFLRIYALFLKGDAVYCPVCEHKFRKFLPYGRINTRNNALCPNCLSLERHRLLWLYLKQNSDFFQKDLKVLHIAPELCFIKNFEEVHGQNYITADIESPLAKVKMDIHEIPFEKEYFNVVLCNHVLEHVKDDRQAMAEVVRVLKPGGWAILQVPFFHPLPEETIEDPSITSRKERERIFGQSDHIRKYGRDYGRRLMSAGFSVEESDFIRTFSKEDLYKYGLPANEIIYVGRKA